MNRLKSRVKERVRSKEPSGSSAAAGSFFRLSMPFMLEICYNESVFQAGERPPESTEGGRKILATYGMASRIIPESEKSNNKDCGPTGF